MDAFKEIKYAVKNTKNPNIEVIILPDTDWDESTSPTVELEAKEEKTDILIPLEVPVDIDGRTYNGIHIWYGQSIGLFDSWFYNKKQDNIGTFGKVGFPAMRFTFFPSDTSGNSLCQKQRYYDKIDGYNFKTLEIQGRSIKFDLGEFKELIEVALEELKK